MHEVKVHCSSVAHLCSTQVSSIMIECARHINLVKIPAENSELLLNRAIQEASYQRRALLRRLINILEADHLARLTYANVSFNCHMYISDCMCVCVHVYVYVLLSLLQVVKLGTSC